MQPVARGIFETSSDCLGILSHSFSELGGAKYSSFKTVYVTSHVSDIILLFQFSKKNVNIAASCRSQGTQCESKSFFNMDRFLQIGVFLFNDWFD